jgi:hypothetical protein
MEEIAVKVRIKYPWLSQEEVLELVENGIGWFYSLRYPSEPSASLKTHPIESFMDTWAVNRMCDEIAQRNGFNTALGYRENGVNFTFDSAWISQGLRDVIIPYAGIF